MFGYSGKVDHLLMPQPGPSGPKVEHSFSSHQDIFQALHNIICVSIQCINNDVCGLKWAWFDHTKKNPPFPSPRSAPEFEGPLCVRKEPIRRIAWLWP